MLTDPRALTGNALLVQQHLHALERLRVDQRLMASLEDLLVFGAALVDNLADVVAVAEQTLDNAGAELLGNTLSSRAGTQSQPFQLGGKLGDRVFAAGVELESQGHEVSPFRVDRHDGDAPPVR
ncbi:MAG TPA: hypothetical protein VGX69_01720 [Solirubrobacteraceae bacterium]|nr:hypothetical protein [Solirubrobacteraceae bacterium]